MALPSGELARERLRGRNWRARKLCTLAGNFAATAKSRPLGEGGCERSEQTEGVSRSAALSQKAALHLPFPSTTPPVKMG